MMKQFPGQRIFALTLIAVAVVVNPWTIGRIFSTSGRMDAPSLMCFVVLLELSLAAFGVRILRIGTDDERRRLGVNAGILLMTLLVLEVALHVVHRYYRLTYTPTSHPQISSSIFRDKPWAKQVVKDLGQIVWR